VGEVRSPDRDEFGKRANDVGRATGRDSRALLADRDVVTAEMYRLGLEQAGYRVDLVTTFDTLVERLEPDVDVVVIEWVHLGLPGAQILRRLRANPLSKALPIFVLTNHDGDIERLRAEAIDAGADEWLVKAHTRPVDLADVLSDALNNAVA
jgi:DNA-binding response OmpR family regulator